LSGSRGHFTVCVLSSALACTFACATAAAQSERVDSLGSAHNRYESPQNFSIEVRVGLYHPDVDSDPSLGGAKPYETVFGTGALIEVGGEFDWEALRIPHFGTLGPGIGVGYANASAKALYQKEHDGTFTSGETTSLTILPFYGVAVLRADALWREVGVPFEPYIKAGVGYAFWRASNTLGTSNYDGVSGTGQSFGTFLAAGLGFNLNVFDRYAAQNFDDAMGVNATYLFAEGTREDLSGLGIQKDPLHVGSTNWTFGVNLEF
jgi:hypothetical protein